MTVEIGLWIGFTVVILFMLALDLGVFHRQAHAVGVREALIWSGVWIALALVFSGAVYVWRGPDLALQFLTGYLIEKFLSVDNIFVFLMIFSYFAVPGKYQHKVLFWGILGALISRALLIAAGITLIERFHWMVYVFGGFLALTGIRMALAKEKEVQPERNPVVRLARRFLPISEQYEGGSFAARRNGKLLFTPLFLVLILVETTDILFAVDSIPAILAVSRDPFIVYASNVFAILGLRSLYMAVAGMMGVFHYLNYGLSAILVLVGAKLLVSNVYKAPVAFTLGSIALILAISIGASVIWPAKAAPDHHSASPS
ncbi:MAG TPA: TerC family protein [Armatimonadota bacterium]|jgi:tellurite resistance protein TerC